ncbi:MAG: uracil-DNA glycosylase [Treponemataceae bacterium]|nr:uracil-DNA glycosylase [Treponemataceae bacterium]
MVCEKDLESISSLVSLADAFFSCRPEVKCDISGAYAFLQAQSVPSAEKEISRDDTNNETKEDTAATLQNIARKVASCKRCRLCGGRKNTVPGTGVPQPLVLVIGEGPGADEDASGEPFVGRAGQLLDKMLAAICLDRKTNCFIANIVKCRPPNNRDPMADEADACRSFLDAQISVLKPKLILTLGRIAVQNLLNTTTGINKLRGQFFEYKGIPLLPTYHPSALLRNEDLKRPAWEDLKLFRSCLEELTGLSFDPKKQNGNAKK